MAAIRRMLRPVVRQLVTYGVSYTTLNQLLKELFIEVAENDFTLSYKRQTDSRVSLMTGINRKEVARLRRSKGDEEVPVEVEDSAVTRVIGRWLGGPPYSDSRGKPRPLPYESNRSNAATFSKLVRDRGIDVPVRSVLDELIRSGVAELEPEGTVVLRQQANTPDGLEGKLTLLGTDPAELFTTIVHNVETPDDPWLQRKVVYDNVGKKALEELREESRELGEEFIRRANVLLSRHDRDRNPEAPGGARCRVVLGAYYFEEAETPPLRRAPTKTPTRKVPGRIKRSS